MSIFKRIKNYFNPKPVPCRCGSVDLTLNTCTDKGCGDNIVMEKAHIECKKCGNNIKFNSDYLNVRKESIRLWNWCNQRVEKGN